MKDLIVPDKGRIMCNAIMCEDDPSFSGLLKGILPEISQFQIKCDLAFFVVIVNKPLD